MEYSIKRVKDGKLSFFYTARNVLLTPLPFIFIFLLLHNFIIFLPQFFYSLHTILLFSLLLHHLIYSMYFSIHRKNRLHIDPRLNFFFQHSFVNSETTTSFLLFFHHHHHHQVSIASLRPPPPPPSSHFYCFPPPPPHFYSFSLPRRTHFYCFPPPPPPPPHFYCFPPPPPPPPQAPPHFYCFNSSYCFLIWVTG